MNHVSRGIFWYVVLGDRAKSGVIITLCEFVCGHTEFDQNIVGIGHINGVTPTVIDLRHFVTTIE